MKIQWISPLILQLSDSVERTSSSEAVHVGGDVSDWPEGRAAAGNSPEAKTLRTSHSCRNTSVSHQENLSVVHHSQVTWRTAVGGANDDGPPWTAPQLLPVTQG